MLETIARAEAPRDLLARGRASLESLEARDARAHGGRRVGFALTAAACVVVIVGALWIGSRHATTPSSPIVAARIAPTKRANSNASHSLATASVVPVTPALATAPGTDITRHRRPWPKDDHDRALPPLEVLPAVLQPDIAPRSLETTSIEIDHLNAIAPLTVQGGRDTSGRGDF
jgi:hypothetical protein